MNRIIKIITSVIFIFTFSNYGYSQDKNKQVITDTLMVSGVCEMCEERIENAALIKGVKKVEWSTNTHSLVVVYREDKVTLDQIAESIAEAGHDNELVICTDEQYDKVHSCCKYRDLHSH